MYLDHYTGTHTGQLLQVGSYSTTYNYFIKLDVDFEDEFNSAGDYPNQLVIQNDKPLGQRLAALPLNQYVGQRIIIKRFEGTTVLEFYLCLNEDITPIGIISHQSEWEPFEEEELWKYYQLGYSTAKLSELFGRNEVEQIIPKINQLLRDRINNTPINPKGISDFLSFSPTDDQNLYYVVGACTYGKLGEWKSSLSEGVMSQEETLFAIVKKVAYKDTSRPFHSDVYFSIDTSSKEITQEKDSLPLLDKTKKKFQDSINDENSFISSNINRLSNEIDRFKKFYIWIRLEDFNDDGEFNSYYYAISDKKDTLNPFRERASEFLRYIMYLKSQLSYEHNQLLIKQEQEIKHQSVKSAIAFIMSRNMSHNLGSHFLYYTKEDLWNSAARNPADSASYLRGASKVIDYVQGRMNYLAAVTSDDKIPYNSINFKTQIFNSLIVDEISLNEVDVSKRVDNFLLKNIVKSEKYTRSDASSGKLLTTGALFIKLSVWDSAKECYRYFEELKDSDNDLKQKYASLELALPGGLIGIQAFYNVVENFIRNSAKYHWGKDPRPTNLTITIRLKIEETQKLSVTIIDNKHNASSPKGSGDNITLRQYLENQLETLRIIEENLSINQENKGLKEMLLSTLWLNSNEYDESFSSIIQRYDQNRKNIIERQEILKKFGFVFVCERVEGCKNNTLGIKFSLPLFIPILPLNSYDTHIHSDIVSIQDENLPEGLSKSKISNCFPRVIFNDRVNNLLCDFVIESPNSEMYFSACALSKAIGANLGDIDKYILTIKETEPVEDFPEDSYSIQFESHVNVKGISAQTFNNYYKNVAYVDSISGENYTKVLEEMFLNGLADRNGKLKYIRWSDKYLSLKIKESAMTRITIIDERLFNGLAWVNCPGEGNFEFKDTGVEMSLKNVRVLNYFKAGDIFPENTAAVDKFDVLRGNEFRPFGHLKESPNATDFLSIHVSLIEKMLKDHNFLEQKEYCGPMGTNPLSVDRVGKFMSLLNKTFSPANPGKLRICVHSGRGKLSEDLELSLSGYPLINFQTLESSFHNSKFLLSQIFYNLVYNSNELDFIQKMNN